MRHRASVVLHHACKNAHDGRKIRTSNVAARYRVAVVRAVERETNMIDNKATKTIECSNDMDQLTLILVLYNSINSCNSMARRVKLSSVDDERYAWKVAHPITEALRQTCLIAFGDIVGSTIYDYLLNCGSANDVLDRNDLNHIIAGVRYGSELPRERT